MKMCKILFIIALCTWNFPAVAGKVESVQEVLKKECSQGVTYDQALALIRALYLTCIPGTQVVVSNKCKVRCLKPNSGAVIGR
ncbi:hypothetical protein [Bdellovibrio bacteriovorus]|uniref:hypothetical protein n=1 Tax=Bdellovibrio TaxID=958 RepID=UPI0035A8409B